ncbi:MAG: nucleotide sugar dehydrogenase [Chitinophagales bacterium]|nr:nucleotide sugar dehydrogenase [Chitinophagales bacterium]MDW8419193.1 nucleotide sugar dehydrogenase [Chitinophagales bacterium]
MQAEKHIAVIGIGKLGLCFALNAARAGFRVTGVDVDEAYIEQINGKTFRSPEPHVNEYLQACTRLRATTRIEEAPDADMLFVFVATPARADGSYSHEQVERVAGQLLALPAPVRQKHLVVGCTTMPGYCDELARKMLPHGYVVSYNPGFIAQGNILYDQQHPDVILIGEANREAGDAIEEVHRSFCKTQPEVHRMDRLSAEIAKLAVNCYLTTKISFANLIGDLALKAGADPARILDAVGADSRIGKKYLRYGDGYGGPCLSRDNRALQCYAHTLHQPLPIASATDVVNEMHLHERVRQMLDAHSGSEVIEVEDVAYKPGTVYIDESQRLRMAVLLAEAGKKVRIADRTEVIEQVKKIYGDLFSYRVK